MNRASARHSSPRSFFVADDAQLPTKGPHAPLSAARRRIKRETAFSEFRAASDSLRAAAGRLRRNRLRAEEINNHRCLLTEPEADEGRALVLVRSPPTGSKALPRQRGRLQVPSRWNICMSALPSDQGHRQRRKGGPGEGRKLRPAVRPARLRPPPAPKRPTRTRGLRSFVALADDRPR